MPDASTSSDYALLDSGGFQKLERFGPVVLSRPCAQAVWHPSLPRNEWQQATATFFRDGGNQWRGRDRLPESWIIQVDGIRFQLSSTDFGHLGIFQSSGTHGGAFVKYAPPIRGSTDVPHAC